MFAVFVSVFILLFQQWYYNWSCDVNRPTIIYLYVCVWFLCRSLWFVKKSIFAFLFVSFGVEGEVTDFSLPVTSMLICSVTEFYLWWQHACVVSTNSITVAVLLVFCCCCFEGNYVCIANRGVQNYLASQIQEANHTQKLLALNLTSALIEPTSHIPKHFSPKYFPLNKVNVQGKFWECQILFQTFSLFC